MKRLVGLILCAAFSAFAQSGGTYRIEKSLVVAGGAASSGANFTLESTSGQPLAGGSLQGSRFSIQNGFLTFDIAPTAAGVSIGGRVTTFGGQGIQNVRVALMRSNGEIQTTLTGSFGNYRFSNIPVGETYVLTVSSRRFVFVNPNRIIVVNDELNDLDFVAEGQ